MIKLLVVAAMLMAPTLAFAGSAADDPYGAGNPYGDANPYNVPDPAPANNEPQVQMNDNGTTTVCDRVDGGTSVCHSF